jgi:hypothetical protein
MTNFSPVLKRLTIQIIHAKDCEDCVAMKDAILQAVKESSACGSCQLEELDSESNEAIDLAIDNDINNLPSCIIGSTVFCGKNSYTHEKLLDAIENAWDNID